MTRPRSAGGMRGVNYVAKNDFGTVAGDPDLRWYSYATPRNTTATAAGP